MPKEKIKPSTTKSSDTRQDWPFILSWTPKVFLGIIATWLLVAWGAFLLVDIFGIINLDTDRPMWRLLFNDRPVEWTQWFLLAFAAAIAAYLGGQLQAQKQRNTARFFLLLGIGFGLMLIEDAGDIRHAMTAEIGRMLDGSRIFGVPYRFVFELPYFTALAAVPVYAVVRYGRYAWRSVSSRKYLISGVTLYAMASIGSVASNIGNFYGHVGAWVDKYIFAGHFPPAPGQSEGWAHFYLADSVLEESIELLAIALLLTAILTFIQDLRNGRLQPSDEKDSTARTRKNSQKAKA